MAERLYGYANKVLSENPQIKNVAICQLLPRAKVVDAGCNSVRGFTQ